MSAKESTLAGRRVVSFTPNVRKGQLVILLDNSGSMHGNYLELCRNWRILAARFPELILIEFNVTARRSKEPTRPDNGTNILAGFEEAMKITGDMTLVLISDGDDTVNKLPSIIIAGVKRLLQSRTASVINFITIAVGSGFPTQLAMGLHSILHSGPASTIPMIVFGPNFAEELVKYCQISEATLNCEIFEYLNVGKRVIYGPTCGIVETTEPIAVDGQLIPIVQNKEVVVELLSQWLTNAQKRSVAGEKVDVVPIIALIDTEIATVEAQFPCSIKGRLAGVKSTMILRQIKNKFRELNNTVYRTDEERQTMLACALNEAKGKFKGVVERRFAMSDDKFRKDLRDFIEIVRKILKELPPGYESKQPKSMIHLQNTLDIIIEDGFIEALEDLLASGYGVEELSKIFILPGFAVKFKRFDQTAVCVFHLLVEKISDIVQNLDFDTVKDGGIKIKGEEFDAVIPLNSDPILAPIFASNIVKFMMSLMVTRNYSFVWDAYLSALAALNYYCLNQPQSEFMQNMIESIKYTAECVGGQPYKNYREMITSTQSLMTEIDGKKICQHFNQVFLSGDQFTHEYWLKLIVEFLGRCQKKVQFEFNFDSLVEQFNPTNELIAAENIFDENDFKKYVRKLAMTLKIIIKVKEIEKLKFYGFDLSYVLKQIQPTPEEWVQIIDASNRSGSFERCNLPFTPVQDIISNVKRTIEIPPRVYNAMRIKYCRWFDSCHNEIIPEIANAQAFVEIKTPRQFNGSGLSMRFCQANECPFHRQDKNNLSDHLAFGNNNRSTPGLHKAILNSVPKTVDVILENFRSGVFLKEDDQRPQLMLKIAQWEDDEIIPVIKACLRNL
jgi:hypothetical protein